MHDNVLRGMEQEVTESNSAQSRIVRREDMVSCSVAFIDCKLPGSMLKENYSIIGSGVTQSEDQVVNLNEDHGFAIGAAAMPNGITNNLHIHYTAEVFTIFRGEWLFRWGADGAEGEFIGREGDVLSMPTWIFRGFTNVGQDDGWIFTSLGRDDTGGVIWHPTILRGAAEHGLFLHKTNMLVDLSTGADKPADDELMHPLSDDVIAGLRRYTPDDMRARITTADERKWCDHAFLQSAIEGHAAALAPVIGFGMTEDRNAAPKVTNPHGFSVEWLRIEAGNSVGPYRIEPKQVLIVKSGSLEIEMGDGSRVTANPWDVFSAPEGSWRTLRAVGDEPVEATVTTAGDGRATIEWTQQTIDDAMSAGFGIDPNGYIAPAQLLPLAEAA